MSVVGFDMILITTIYSDIWIVIILLLLHNIRIIIT